MLNKEEMQDFSIKVADILQSYLGKEKDGRTKRSNEVNALFAASSKIQVIKALTDILEKTSSSNAEILGKLKSEIHFLPNQQEWQYLMILIRFDLIFLQKQVESK